MIIKVDKSFKKDLLKIKDEKIRSQIIYKIDQFYKVEKIFNLVNLKKLKGFDDLYRLRVGDYRVGFRYKDDEITLLRVRSRKDIYNIFP